MFEEFPEYLTVDWLRIGGYFKGAHEHQMIEDVGGIALDDYSPEQEAVLANQFNFVHIIVSGEPFKTLKVISRKESLGNVKRSNPGLNSLLSSTL